MTKRGLKKLIIKSLLVGSVVLAACVCWDIGISQPEKLKTHLIKAEIVYFLADGGFLLAVYHGFKSTLED